MSDIATISNAGPINLGFDWAIALGALQVEDGLDTAVINSLFSDRVAPADLELPDNSGDRRGWWADVPLDGGKPDPIGSLLWTLARAKATRQTAARAQRYAVEALQWLKDDGIADGVEVAAEYASREQLRLNVVIVRQVAGQPVNHRYDFLWNVAQANGLQ